MSRTIITAVALGAAALSGCAAKPDTASPTSKDGSAETFSAIRDDETIKLLGTEPFWGGTLSGGTLTYTPPETPKGTAIAVRRFAGMGGLGFSGTLEGKPLDLAINAQPCSDGMSDRRFPFTATLRIGGEQREGCAYTARAPFTGDQ